MYTACGYHFTNKLRPKIPKYVKKMSGEKRTIYIHDFHRVSDAVELASRFQFTTGGWKCSFDETQLDLTHLRPVRSDASIILINVK
jgi:hypothetical protein